MLDQKKNGVKNSNMTRCGPNNGRWKGGISKDYARRIVEQSNIKDVFYRIPEEVFAKEDKDRIISKLYSEYDNLKTKSDFELRFLGVYTASIEEFFVTRRFFENFLWFGFVPEIMVNCQFRIGKSRIDWFIKELGIFIEYHPEVSFHEDSKTNYKKKREDILEEFGFDEPLVVLTSLKEVSDFTQFITRVLNARNVI